ncbi:MAG: hypothetical protein EOQ50_10325 [Mesorhizobium sp.]|uniref:hypothetical protein n=1 Tax=Mesorhizobium sp. TaxID=1871066 RepID=UPI000FE7DD1F|nr:hypothetical protein [Mesorhizobium sp.]RWB75869.1 MAG: hypothetical protein EOQ50_10325 [Mesorhizobium sp.]
MPIRETQLQIAERHVSEGAQRIARQRALIVWMTERGLPTAEAQIFLRELQAAQRELTAHLERLRAE